MKGQETSASWLLRMVPCRHSLEGEWGEGWRLGSSEAHLTPHVVRPDPREAFPQYLPSYPSHKAISKASTSVHPAATPTALV